MKSRKAFVPFLWDGVAEYQGDVVQGLFAEEVECRIIVDDSAFLNLQSPFPAFRGRALSYVALLPSGNRAIESNITKLASSMGTRGDTSLMASPADTVTYPLGGTEDILDGNRNAYRALALRDAEHLFVSGQRLFTTRKETCAVFRREEDWLTCSFDLVDSLVPQNFRYLTVSLAIAPQIARSAGYSSEIIDRLDQALAEQQDHFSWQRPDFDHQLVLAVDRLVNVLFNQPKYGRYILDDIPGPLEDLVYEGMHLRRDLDAPIIAGLAIDEDLIVATLDWIDRFTPVAKPYMAKRDYNTDNVFPPERTSFFATWWNEIEYARRQDLAPQADEEDIDAITAFHP